MVENENRSKNDKGNGEDDEEDGVEWLELGDKGDKEEGVEWIEKAEDDIEKK